MDYPLFKQYRDTIINLSPASGIDERLLLDREGELSVYYAPFEHVNTAARVVIVGITPGKTQMRHALLEAQRQLRSGADDSTAVRLAKQTGAFSGTLRNNLVNLLDHIGLHEWLGTHSTSSLFNGHAHLVQMASVLRYPVLFKGNDYNGNPNMLKNPLLRRHLLTHFGGQVEKHPNAVFIPLGDKPAQALAFLADQGAIDARLILDGLPHPSGSNAERIAYFLGNKGRHALSPKTDPDKMDIAKANLLSRMRVLMENVECWKASKIDQFSGPVCIEN